MSRLLLSIVKGEELVVQPTGDKIPSVKIPLTRLNELIRVIKARAIPSTTPQDNQNADGLTLLPGTSPSLYLGDASDLLIAENPHIYVTPDTKVHTLAELLIKHSTGTLSSEDRSAELKNLGRMLKGLHVSVRVGCTVEERFISAMWDGNSKPAPSRLRHHAWTLKRGDYPLADLPCVNVGSSLDPVLLPPELCNVLPGHDLRGEHLPCISRSIEALRRDAPLVADASAQQTRGHLIPRPHSRQKIDNLQVVSDKLDGVLPRVLFLEAGTEGVKSSSWIPVREALKKQMRRVSKSLTLSIPDKDVQPLSLQYEATPDIKDLWTQQISKFVNTDRPTNRGILLIVCLQSEEVHAAMYDIIKKACDVEVGVQSIFVNGGTFGAKSHNKPSQAAAMVVGSICRKLRLRNPPMLPKRATQTGSHHLVVSIHAKSFNVQTPCVLEDGSQGPGNPELVLVALVSHALGSSEDYYTDVKLCNKSEYEKQDVAQLFRTFFSCIKNSPHALTVLRSGHLVDDSVKLQDSRLLKEKNDIADFCDVAGKAFTYATLSEDKLLKIRFNDRNDASEDNKHRDLLIVQSSVGEDKSQSCFRVFHEQQAPDGTTGIKVTLHPHASTSSTRPAQSLTPQQSSRTRKVSVIAPLPMQELGSPIFGTAAYRATQIRRATGIATGA